MQEKKPILQKFNSFLICRPEYKAKAYQI